MRVRLRVRFAEGCDEGYHARRLHEDLIRFLSPWAYKEGGDIVLGGRIYATSILDFVDRRPYVDYVAGLYYFNERAEEVAATPNTNTWNSTGTGYTIRDAMTWQRSALSISRASYANSKSYAAFGQMTWTPGGLDTLHLTVGGRYTHDEKSGDLYKVNNAASAFPFAFKYNRFDPLAIVAWDAGDGVNLYAKYSPGYRAGGASSRSINFATFGPENVKAYEVGPKTEFFDRRS